MYSLQRNIKYDNPVHFRDFITKGPNKKFEKEIKKLEIDTSKQKLHLNNEYDENKFTSYIIRSFS